MADGVAGLEIRIAETLRDTLVEHADLPQRAQRRTTERNAQSAHRPVRVDFDDLGTDAGALERNGERHPGDAAADDERVLDRCHLHLRAGPRSP
jgi:hypothetical protein